jgi:DNA-directed RNA polymerase subunit RPC12/RpoP
MVECNPSKLFCGLFDEWIESDSLCLIIVLGFFVGFFNDTPKEDNNNSTTQTTTDVKKIKLPFRNKRCLHCNERIVVRCRPSDDLICYGCKHNGRDYVEKGVVAATSRAVDKYGAEVYFVKSYPWVDRCCFRCGVEFRIQWIGGAFRCFSCFHRYSGELFSEFRRLKFKTTRATNGMIVYLLDPNFQDDLH